MTSAEESRKPNALRILWDGENPPARNMARDEALLVHRFPEPTLRLYSWSPPCLSLGYFQERRSERDGEKATRPDPIPGGSLLKRNHGGSNPSPTPVRRATGGGAIFHHREITYSFSADLEFETPVGPLGALTILESYELLHRPIREALEHFGLNPRTVEEDEPSPVPGLDPFFCFNRRSSSDLLLEGGKVLGSAQRRTAHRLLQHGSLLLFGEPAIPGSIGVNDVLGKTAAEITFEALGDRLVTQFAHRLELPSHRQTFTGKEVALAEEFEPRYRDPNWSRKKVRLEAPRSTLSSIKAYPSRSSPRPRADRARELGPLYDPEL